MKGRRERFDAIVTLGGGVSEAGELSSCSRSRTDKAVELYTLGLAARIIFCGKWSRNMPVSPPTTEAEAMARYARDLGVSEESILLEPFSMNTLANAYYAKLKVIEPLGFRALALVTSPSHMPRSRWLFKQICGTEYYIQGYEAGHSTGVRPAEVAGYFAMKQLFKDVQPGDHETVSRLLPELQAA